MARTENRWGWALTALVVLLLAGGLSALTLFPDLQFDLRSIAYVSMSFSAITLLWPIAVLVSLIALFRSPKIVSLGLILASLAGTYWFVRPVVVEQSSAGDSQVTTLVVHYQGDLGTVENLTSTRLPDVVQIIGLPESAVPALSAPGVLEQYPHRLFRNGISVLSTWPLSMQTEGQNLLVVNVQQPSQNWVIAFIDFPTPIDDVETWQSSARSLAGMISPYRSGNLIVLGDGGNNRFSAPFNRLAGLGLADARVQARVWNASSWPRNSMIRPIMTFDHAFVSRSVLATEYQRIAFSNDDYQGFSARFTTKQS